VIAVRRLSVIVLGLLSILACEVDPPPPPSLDDVLGRFGVRQQVTSQGDSSRPEIRLFIDRSLSMRGFVEAGDSQYRRILDAVLDHAESSGCALHPFGFASGVEPLAGGGKLELALQSSFYDGLNTDFQGLFARAVPRPGEVSVIVSDFVQSAGGEDQRALVAAMNDHDAARWQVLLLAFRSAFRGWYYVETPGAAERRFHLDLDGVTAATGRPFYVLVLSSSRRDLEAFRRYVLADVHGDEELAPSQPALEAIDVEAVPAEPAGGAGRWSRSQQLERSLPAVSAGSGHVSSFIALGGDHDQLPPLRLAVAARARTPLRSMGDLAIEVAAKTRSRTGWRDKPSAVPRAEWAPPSKGRPMDGAALNTPDAGASFVISLDVPRPSRGAWDVYRVRVAPGEGNLLPPLWVESWTAYDDSLPANANRTLKLRLLVEALIRAIQERVPILDEFILVRRED
jgi:hypothetical protein